MSAGSVSVVMPFHADEEWFPAALESVLSQTRPPNEVIVVDDASPAGSRRVLGGLPEMVTMIPLERNSGPGCARAVGTDRATGEFISYLDSDDLWPPDFLERCLGRLHANAALAAVYTGIEKRYADGRIERFDRKPALLDLRETLVRFHAYPAIGMCFRREAIEAIGGWDRSRQAVEDWDLVVRLLERHGPVPLIPDLFPVYRIGHQADRMNRRHWRKLRRWWHTARRNRAILEAEFGRGAARRRFAQAVYDRGRMVGGAVGRVLVGLAVVFGPPLERLHPEVSQ